MSDRRDRGPVVELAVAVLAVAATIALGHALGWQGRPKDAISTALWPFYFDTWFPAPVWTGRALLPLATGALAWLALRQWTRDTSDKIGALAGLVAAAWVVHLALGAQRHGIEQGLRFTFSRAQEYWNDVRFVNGSFLSGFPDGLGVRLSQHGETHPPGLTLLLAGLKALGFTDPHDAELACSFAGALGAFPLFGATRRLAGDGAARLAVPLYLFACSVSLYSVLAMDAVTMLVSAVALYGLARALDGDPWGGALWGLAFAATTMCTFASLTQALAYGALLAAKHKTLLQGSNEARRRRFALALGPASFLGGYAVLHFATGYRPLHAYQACLAAFKVSDNARRSTGRALLGNPVAFLGGLGFAVAGLAGRACGTAAKRLLQRSELETPLLVLAGLLPPALCTVLGSPRAEVEHIFLPFVPTVILGAAAAGDRWYRRAPSWLLWIVPLLVVESVAVQIFWETYW